MVPEEEMAEDKLIIELGSLPLIDFANGDYKIGRIPNKYLVFEIEDRKIIRLGTLIDRHARIRDKNLIRELKKRRKYIDGYERVGPEKRDLRVWKGDEKAYIHVIGGGNVKVRPDKKIAEFSRRSIGFGNVKKDILESIIEAHNIENPDNVWSMTYRSE